MELTPSTSFYNWSKGGASHQVHFGAQLGYGFTDRIEGRFRVEQFFGLIDYSDTSFHFKGTAVSVAPKVSLVRNKLSFHLPVGFAFGQDIQDYKKNNTIMAQPTLIFSNRFSKHFELTVAAKYARLLSETANETIGLNLGLGLSPDVDKWLIRPEFGLHAGSPGLPEWIRHFGIGFSFRMDSESRK